MKPGARLGLALALGLGLGLTPPSVARADVIDDAYAAGSEAANAGDWVGAVEQWQAALELLPGRSAQLDYDLGTAYAQLGELGRATYHFERALAAEARPSVEVAEAARRNRGIVRRRAELQAEVNDAQLSREPTTWDRFVRVLAGPGLGWFSLVCGWALIVLLISRRSLARRAREAHAPRGISGALVLIFALVFGVGGGVHALALETTDQHPEAIALDALVEAREGPGAHLPVAFAIQGGARVRVLDQRPGWLRVRMPGGLEGWAPLDAIARLDKGPVRSRVRAAETADPPEP